MSWYEWPAHEAMVTTNLQTNVSAEMGEQNTAFITYKMRYTTQEDAGIVVRMEDTFQVPEDVTSIDVQPYSCGASAGHRGVREGVEVRTSHKTGNIESVFTWRIGLNAAKRQCCTVLHERTG
jgi:hypothetical protein